MRRAALALSLCLSLLSPPPASAIWAGPLRAYLHRVAAEAGMPYQTVWHKAGDAVRNNPRGRFADSTMGPGWDPHRSRPGQLQTEQSIVRYLEEIDFPRSLSCAEVLAAAISKLPKRDPLQQAVDSAETVEFIESNIMNDNGVLISAGLMEGVQNPLDDQLSDASRREARQSIEAALIARLKDHVEQRYGDEENGTNPYEAPVVLPTTVQTFDINAVNHAYSVIAEGFDYDLSPRRRSENIASMRDAMMHLLRALKGRTRAPLLSAIVPITYRDEDNEGARQRFSMVALINPSTEKALFFVVRRPSNYDEE